MMDKSKDLSQKQLSEYGNQVAKMLNLTPDSIVGLDLPMVKMNCKYDLVQTTLFHQCCGLHANKCHVLCTSSYPNSDLNKGNDSKGECESFDY